MPTVTAPTTVGLTDAYFPAGQCAAPIRGKAKGTGPPYVSVDCRHVSAVAEITKRSATAVPPRPDVPTFLSIPGRTGKSVSALAVAAARSCADNTDLLLDLGQNLLQVTGAASVLGGLEAYACLRNLEAPHPGDAGMGGGAKMIVGDCVYVTTSTDGTRATDGVTVTLETPCDGTGANRPEYRLARVFIPTYLKGDTNEVCPKNAATRLSLSVPSTKFELFSPAACAEKL
ncbi:hypothetical protein ACFCX4_24275 [Kitasatospora sp. NPDC056327]|uniref:hypothetical protein n=1 Tax=Kitasatospora sp. NPDC056327 TaxID=3345785 RepID=UPI0035E36513